MANKLGYYPPVGTQKNKWGTWPVPFCSMRYSPSSQFVTFRLHPHLDHYSHILDILGHTSSQRHQALRERRSWAAVWLKAIKHLQKDEFLRLVINSIRNDLTSRNEAFHCLALGFVGSGERLDQNQTSMFCFTGFICGPTQSYNHTSHLWSCCAIIRCHFGQVKMFS